MTKPSHISRRALLRNISIGGAAVTALCVTAIRESHAEGSIPKPQSKYQDTPNGDRQCSDCSHFVAPNACKLVAGDISPKGWCQFFARKS